jgi:hypothetical protein
MKTKSSDSLAVTSAYEQYNAEDKVCDGSPLIFRPFAKIRRLHFVFGADSAKRIWHKTSLDKRTI